MLLWAAKKSHDKVVERLLDKPGVDADFRDADGLDALSWAQATQRLVTRPSTTRSTTWTWGPREGTDG